MLLNVEESSSKGKGTARLWQSFSTPEMVESRVQFKVNDTPAKASFGRPPFVLGRLQGQRQGASKAQRTEQGLQDPPLEGQSVTWCEAPGTNKHPGAALKPRHLWRT